jgi:HSP20 family molecular chaperone IbpA
MFRKKCPSCAHKIEKGFNFCPYCGESFKRAKEEENYGLLGKDDSLDLVGKEMKLPFGMDRMLNSLMKQLEKQMNEMNNNENGMPRGFKIKISTGTPQKQQAVQQKPKIVNNFSEEQMKEKIKLPKVEAESKVKRLSDRIIYELEVPGVKSPKEIIITELATGLEIKAYSNDKCYVKFIPLKVELLQYYLEKEKLVLELKL